MIDLHLLRSELAHKLENIPKSLWDQFRIIDLMAKGHIKIRGPYLKIAMDFLEKDTRQLQITVYIAGEIYFPTSWGYYHHRKSKLSGIWGTRRLNTNQLKDT
jgi:hypothetical protein